MKAIYWQTGGVLDYTPAEDAAPGSVVSLGTRIGIAAAGIAAGEKGALQMEGCFYLDKAAGEAIAMGAAVYYDGSADAITGKASAQSGEGDAAATVNHVPAGYAAAPAAANDAAVLVKLLG